MTNAILARALLAVLIVVALGPILWTVLGAFKELRDIVTPVPKLVFTPTLENFATILRNPTIRDGLLHSVIVVSASVLIAGDRSGTRILQVGGGRCAVACVRPSPSPPAPR